MKFIAFRGWKPAADRVAEVASVPYDVVSTAEAKERAAGKPDSYLHVIRPEIDLPAGASFDDEATYAQARVAFARLVADKVITKEPTPAYYAYRQTMGDHSQTGIVGLASTDDYVADRIKKHEHTRPIKEDDRMRHLEAVGAHVGPVFLTYRAQPAIDARVRGLTAGHPTFDYVAEDGVRHTLWTLDDADDAEMLEALFGDVAAFYIADGHHRAAAAARVGQKAGKTGRARNFLAVVFPHDELDILPYNRVITDLGGQTPEAVLERLASDFDIVPMPRPETPAMRHVYAAYTGKRWYALTLRDPASVGSDATAQLDVSVLQDRVLAPVFGIEDPRTDKRIEFVGGIRGFAELEERAKASGGMAFALHPTSLEELLAVSDAGEVMPPKSTWFEPKLRTGLVVHRFDER